MFHSLCEGVYHGGQRERDASGAQAEENRPVIVLDSNPPQTGIQGLNFQCRHPAVGYFSEGPDFWIFAGHDEFGSQ